MPVNGTPQYPGQLSVHRRSGQDRNFFRLFTRFPELTVNVEAAGPLNVRTGAGGGSDAADVMAGFCMPGRSGGGGNSGPVVITPGNGGGQAGATPGAGGGQSGSVSLLDVFNIIGQLSDAQNDADAEPEPTTPEPLDPPVQTPDPAEPGIVPLPCSAEPYARANTNPGRVNFALVNESGSVREIYWIDFEGQRQFDRELRAGQVVNLLTNPNAPWLVTNTAGVCADLLLVFSDEIYSLR